MPKLALNDLKLRSISPPEKGQQDYWDTSLPGFGVRVSQGGSKTFILNIDNARRSIGRFGIITLSEARGEAKRILAERTLGRVRPQAMTYPQARDLFLQEKLETRRASTHKSLKRLLTVHFPFKGQLSEFTHSEVLRRLNSIRAPSEKNHAIAAAKVFFTWCVKHRYLADNPTLGMSLTSRPSRGRVLSDDEVKSVWEASNDLDLPAPFRTIVKLLICTGQRRGEITGIRGEYFSQNECTITFPTSLTKNHREHTFPLGPLATSCLTSLGIPIGLLFPARGRTTPFNGWGKSKALLDEISGVSGWTLHDLRRTFATRLAEIGTPIHVVEKLLNHISGTTGGLVGVYQRHQYWPEQVAAVAAWDRRLQQLLNT